MKAARIEARLSSAALSQRLGRNDNWASQVESGHGSPDPVMLAQLARELGRSVQWIVTGEESGRSEFVDAVAAYEERLDDRARHNIVALAEREAAYLSESGDGDRLVARLRQARPDLAGLLDELAAGSVPTPLGQDVKPEEAPRRRGGRARA